MKMLYVRERLGIENELESKVNHRVFLGVKMNVLVGMRCNLTFNYCIPLLDTLITIVSLIRRCQM